MIRTLLGAIVLLAFAAAAHAGQPCVEKAGNAEATAAGEKLAARVRDHLEKEQLSIVFLGRIGVDLSEFGLRYTHLAVAWRDHPRGSWFTFHLMNKCGTGRSELLEQSLEDFFRVELHRAEALVAAPSFPMQVRMQRAFFGPMATTLHQPEYNMIAHPFSTMYQNSNQWVLEVMASALAAPGTVTSRDQVQAWLKENRYVPDEIPIGPGRRAGARLFSPHVRFSDHTDDEYKRSRYAVVSVESMLRFLERVDPGMKRAEIR